MANKPWTWIITFIKIIKYWKVNEESIYNTLYKEKIETCTLLFKKVVFDFKKKLDKNAEECRGQVAKGFFGLTFNKVRDNKDNIKKKPHS